MPFLSCLCVCVCVSHHSAMSHQKFSYLTTLISIAISSERIETTRSWQIVSYNLNICRFITFLTPTYVSTPKGSLTTSNLLVIMYQQWGSALESYTLACYSGLLPLWWVAKCTLALEFGHKWLLSVLFCYYYML